VRAFDIPTGREAWRFHTVPRPGEFGHDTWAGDSWRKRTGVNAWSGATVDVARGLVFVGTGSPGYDFYGGDRAGDNLFANCVIALDGRTGRRVWHRQLVHHDIWDYDLPTRPCW
jgi:quinoprotein glucose dehydrogenase